MIRPEDWGAQPCERKGCRKPAVKGRRWCTGHAYVGEHWQENRDVVEEVVADSFLDRVRKKLGL